MRRTVLVSIAGGAAYALAASFGHQAQTLGETLPLRALGTAAALWLPCAAVLYALFSLGDRLAARRICKEEKPFRPLRVMALMLACWLPMWLVCFPGAFSYDVPFQLEQVFTGAYSAHHPLAHTLLLGGCVVLGRALGSITLGAALYTAVQMALLAACFAAACASVSRFASARAARWAAAFFAVYPLHMMMSVSATKDVLFGGLFALTLALTTEALLRGVTRRLGASLVLASAGMMLLRNNAVYAAVAWVLLILICMRRRAARVCACVALGIAVSFAANGVMKAATHAVDGDLCEMLSWPIQQMARARSLHGELLTDEERAAVDALMPNESWRLYDPTISDPVKFEFDTQELLRDPGYYAKIYVSIGKKCPKAYADALVMHTYSFWYPYGEYGVSGYYLQLGVTDQYYDWCDFEHIESRSLAPRVLEALKWRFGAQGAMQWPVIGYFFNMGAIVWAMMFFVLRAWRNGGGARLAAAMLPVLLWGTFLLGPVMAGRYIYPFVCALPVLASRERG